MQIQARFCLGEVTRCKMYAPNPEGKDAIEAGKGVEVQQGQVAGDLRIGRIGCANVRLRYPKAAQALIDGRVVGFQQR